MSTLVKENFIKLRCLQFGCKEFAQDGKVWCATHDRGKFRRRARDVFGWSDTDK